MTDNSTTNRPRLSAIKQGPLDEMKNYASNFPEVKDIVTLGLVAQPIGGLWTVGVQGSRWSKEENNNSPSMDPIKQGIAGQYLLKRMEIIRKKNNSIVSSFTSQFSAESLFDESGLTLSSPTALALPGMMDVDIVVPTLIAIFSPLPGIQFDDAPLSAKGINQDGNPGRLDPHCSNPELWKYDGEENQVLIWYSNYDDGGTNQCRVPKIPYRSPKTKCKEEHNYHMTLTSFSIGSGGTHKPGTLPIIIDPGNNNGGTGGVPFP